MSNQAGAAGTPPPPAPPSATPTSSSSTPSSTPPGENPKGRRVVILTPNDALAAGFPIVAAPVTSQIPPIPGPDHVLLPFQNPPGTRHPATGLTRRAGIVATWLVVVDPAAHRRTIRATCRRSPWPSSTPGPRPPPRPSAAGPDRP